MTRHEALTALLAKVEDGTAEKFDPLFEFALYPAQQDMNTVYNANDAYHGSLDAAKALHEAVLHERVVKKEVWSKRYGGTVCLYIDLGLVGVGHSVDDNPARAWLIAILKALIAMEGDQ